MSHKLVIGAVVLHPPDRSNVKPYELIRGEENRISLSVTNIGDTLFPGATLKGIILSFGETRRASLHMSEELELGRLDAEQEVSITQSIDAIPITDGQTWLTLTIEATDGQPIECFQSRDGAAAGTNSWMGAFYTVNREHLRMIELLERLTEGKGG